MENTANDYAANMENVVRAGLKATVAEKMGFNQDRVYIIEVRKSDGLPIWVGFEVNGQGYIYNIKHDAFTVANGYGDRFFG